MIAAVAFAIAARKFDVCRGCLRLYFLLYVVDRRRVLIYCIGEIRTGVAQFDGIITFIQDVKNGLYYLCRWLIRLNLH